MKQKLKRVFKIILIFIFVVIVGMVGFNNLVSTDYNSLNDMDKNMLKQLSQVYETYNNKSQDIWKDGDGFMDKDLYYYVGSLEGILLDKLQINWKDRVESNKLIYDILRDEVHKQVIRKPSTVSHYSYNISLNS